MSPDNGAVVGSLRSWGQQGHGRMVDEVELAEKQVAGVESRSPVDFQKIEEGTILLEPQVPVGPAEIDFDANILAEVADRE